MHSGGRTEAREVRSGDHELRGKSRAGLKILIPGYVQWTWRQRERAAVLFGSFAMAMGVGVFSWGTRMGLALLAFAFGTHVVSAVDVLRQSAFPGFGRWMPLLSASGGLALGVYTPTVLVASLVAWPAMDGVSGMDGYLVNFWAFRSQSPRDGDWVWLRFSPWDDTHVGRVVARAGQEVEWSRNRLQVDGKKVRPDASLRFDATPDELAFIVPTGHVLMTPVERSHRRAGTGKLVLVPNDQVAGRAWARMYPLWERQTLH
ncbi:S26 family signal peptidase [Singulisphaera sp. Ch08]|uniref:S26 family signal peptidase n=1 Tax=Singulisphaera sp. Ch08 TaxID=3120278 RepID=A0AAU7CST2_9BACT